MKGRYGNRQEVFKRVCTAPVYFMVCVSQFQHELCDFGQVIFVLWAWFAHLSIVQ